MSYAFPPPVPISVSVLTLALCSLILAFAIAAIFRIFAWHEERSPASRLRLSLIAVVLGVLIVVSGLLHPQTRGRLDEYLGFWNVLLYSLAVMTLVRQLRKRPHSLLRALPAACLAILLAMGISPLPPPFPNISPPAYWKPDCRYRLRLLSIVHANVASGRSGQLTDAAVHWPPSAPAAHPWTA
ncbi:MAG TPA: hypothetical protein VGM05_02430 [Planctomycetaceae bacterium]|jgi:hypothetical protein